MRYRPRTQLLEKRHMTARAVQLHIAPRLRLTASHVDLSRPFRKGYRRPEAEIGAACQRGMPTRNPSASHDEIAIGQRRGCGETPETRLSDCRAGICGSRVRSRVSGPLEGMDVIVTSPGPAAGLGANLTTSPDRAINQLQMTTWPCTICVPAALRPIELASSPHRLCRRRWIAASPLNREAAHPARTTWWILLASQNNQFRGPLPGLSVTLAW
jgi:hypothetical protein